VTMEVNVLYGRGVRTGGPEALHQLVHELRAVGVSAYLVPDRNTLGAVRVPEYDGYDAPERATFPDEPGQVVVAPEVYLPELLSLHRARRLCWWLSIDNSPVFRAERYLADVLAGLADPPRAREVRALLWLARREIGGWRRRPLHAVEHAAQSRYAAAYLSRRLGIEVPLLTDYIPGASAEIVPEQMPQRPPAVAFNPAKGRRLLGQVRKQLGDAVDWHAIQGLSPEGVRQLLGESTVYLDLGPHPGRDRMPREAALAGAVTVVARRGSGDHEEDVGIPPHHKVALGDHLAERAAGVVSRILEDPSTAYAEQAAYRAGIQLQEDSFRSEVAALVARLEVPPRQATS